LIDQLILDLFIKKNKKENKQLVTGKEFDRLSKQFYSLTGKTTEKFFFSGLRNRQKKVLGQPWLPQEIKKN
jgi:hypothetical protein